MFSVPVLGSGENTAHFFPLMNSLNTDNFLSFIFETTTPIFSFFFLNTHNTAGGSKKQIISLNPPKVILFHHKVIEYTSHQTDVIHNNWNQDPIPTLTHCCLSVFLLLTAHQSQGHVLQNDLPLH